MKKVSKVYLRRYRTLRLYKDDLREVVELAARCGDKVTITAEDDILETLGELDKLQGHFLSYVYIETSPDWDKPPPYRRAYLSLTLARYGAKLRVSDRSDAELMGLSSQIDFFLTTRYNWLSYATSLWTVGGVLGLQVVLLLAVLLAKTTGGLPSWEQAIANPVSWLFTAYILWGNYINWRRHIVVFLTERNSTPSFLARNKDAIAVNVITNTVTAIVTALITWLITTRR